MNPSQFIQFHPLVKPFEIQWSLLCANHSWFAMQFISTLQLIFEANGLEEMEEINPINLLEKYFEHIDWNQLSTNSSSKALSLLEKHKDYIHWSNLSYNPHPKALQMLASHIEYIDWSMLSMNVNVQALSLLEQHPDKMDSYWIFLNPNIFTYDYSAIKEKLYSNGLGKELMENRFHPKNIAKFVGWGFDGLEREDN